MIAINHLSKTYRTADGEIEALKDVSLRISDGDIFGIIGMSGAGKSTLVRCINMLERPSIGSVEIDGCDLGRLTEAELRKVRRNVTMIFQGFNLLLQRTCLQNVCFPLKLAGVKKAQARKRALELLELVGLQDKANAYPAQLSGGQQQRVAIARALINNPPVLFADEPTGNLDSQTSIEVMNMFTELNRKEKITIILVTHSQEIADCAKRVIRLSDGMIRS